MNYYWQGMSCQISLGLYDQDILQSFLWVSLANICQILSKTKKCFSLNVCPCFMMTLYLKNKVATCYCSKHLFKSYPPPHQTPHIRQTHGSLRFNAAEKLFHTSSNSSLLPINPERISIHLIRGISRKQQQYGSSQHQIYIWTKERFTSIVLYLQSDHQMCLWDSQRKAKTSYNFVNVFK